MMEMEEVILHSEADPEVSIIQEGHTEDIIIIWREVTVDSRGLEFKPDYQPEDQELYQGLPAEIKIDVSIVDNWNIPPKNVLRRTHLQRKCSIEMKGCLSTKDIPSFLKVIKKKNLWQQCITVLKLTVPSN